MINVNQLSTELRMMPDQALQRMAMMYKNDPYIFPMVISEDMARKKMRQAAQAQGQVPQMKVADQAIMAMGEQPQQAAPGIAALQAPNMQNMADGGIAGYDDAEGYAGGGEVMMPPGATPSYQRTAMSPGMLDFAQRSEPVVRMSGGGVPGYQTGGQLRRQPPYPGLAQYEDLATGKARAGTLLPTTTGYEGMSIDEFISAAYNDVSDALKKLYGKIPKELWAQEAVKDLAEKKRREQGEESMRPAAGVPRRTPRTLAIEEAELAARSGAMPSSEPLREPPTINPETGQEYTAFDRAAQTAAPTAPAAAATGLRTPPVSGAPTGAGAAPIGAGASTFRSDPSLYSLDPAVHRKRAQELMPTNAYETAFNVQAQKEREREEARELERERAKPTGKAKEGLEALLQQEAKGTEKEMSDAGAFALIRAGLAIASGSSPNALKNIADGLNVGAQEYQAAIKDLKKADRERKLILADIQEARRLEERGDYDRAQDRKDRAADRETARERFTMSGIMQLGMNRDQIAAGFAKATQEGLMRRDIAALQEAGTAARHQQDIISRKEIAELPGAQERIITQLGGGDFKKGYDIYKQEGQMPTLFSAYEKLASDTTIDGTTGKTKGAMFRARYPDFQAYKAEFERSQTGGGAAPKVSADPLGIR